MKITFILHKLEISGGHKAVFEFANHLHNRGHDVSVVYPLVPMRSGAKWYNIRNLANRAKRTIVRLRQSTRVEWFNLKASLIRVPTLAERYIPDADIVVATWWETAYCVNRYSDSKGEKFYLAQHYEIWGGPEEEVNNSYKLGLRIIVNSTWLKNILRDKLNVKIEALILHAPDLDQFYSENKEKSNDTIRILMPYRKIQWKGIEDGINAFRIVREKYPHIQLVMFGPGSDKDVPKYVEFYEKPDSHKLRKIYNSCDIFVFPSHCEGFGMPPMEAMACGVACIVTNVGAVPNYTIPGKTAIVVPPRDPESLANACIDLLENDRKRNQIAKAGHEYVQQFTWDKVVDQLQKIFQQTLNQR